MYTFKRPTRAQVAQQIAVWSAEDGAVLRKLLDECKVDAVHRFEVLREHDRRSRLLGYGLACAFEHRRSGDIIRAACGAEPDALPFTADELVEIAAELWGMNPRAAPDPLVQSPAEKSPTGSSSTPSSDTGTDAIRAA